MAADDPPANPCSAGVRARRVGSSRWRWRPPVLSPVLEISRPMAADDPPANPWFTWDYARNNRDDILSALQEHVIITVESVLIALVISFPLALLAHRYRRPAGPVRGVPGVLSTLPSIAT